MNVAEFRNLTDHVYRIHNVDRQACVSTDEARRHIEIAQRFLHELQEARQTIKRATHVDHERARRACETVAQWLGTEANEWAADRTANHSAFCRLQQLRRLNADHGA